MDLVPKPDQLVSAASNVAHALMYGGLADLRPMPRMLIDEGTRREVYHYRPDTMQVATGDPVLLVAPLAAPSLAYDLRRGASLVEDLVAHGRPAYLVEYGAVSVQDRTLDVEPWVYDVVPAAIRAVSEHAGGRPVHVVGWSLGGIFALLAAAGSPDLPLSSLSVLGSPVDTKQVPLTAPVRPLLDPARDAGALTRLVRATGVGSRPVVEWALQTGLVQRLVTTPLALTARLDDSEFLAQVEAVQRFAERMIAYPGRSYGQLYHRFVPGNALVDGAIELGDRVVALADVRVPVLVFAGATDGIAPVSAVRAVLPLLSGSPDVRFEIVPGGHLGLLTGRAARETTWVALDDWFEEWSGAAVPAAAPAPKPRRRPVAKTTKTATGPRSAAVIAASRKAAAPTKTAARKTAASQGTPTRKAAPAKKASASTTSTRKTTPAQKATSTTRAASARKASASKTAAKKTSPAATSPARKTKPTKPSAGRKTSPARKATAATSPARKAAAAKKPATKKSTPEIGTSAQRRYGSGSSRSLAPRNR